MSPLQHLPIRWPARLLAALACALPAWAPAATVHLANIVPVATAVNNFELAPAHVAFTWSQQGISATQVGGEIAANAIWLDSGLGHGTRSWYPDGGDDGWTRLSLDNGDNFDAISFFGGSGWITPPQSLYFELADDGVVVLSGTLNATFGGSWFGFAGGDFDEVRIRASQGAVNGLFDCPSGGAGPNNGCNFAWVDDIRVGAAAVPVPSTAWLVLPALLLAIGGLGGAGKAQAFPAGHCTPRTNCNTADKSCYRVIAAASTATLAGIDGAHAPLMPGASFRVKVCTVHDKQCKDGKVAQAISVFVKRGDDSIKTVHLDGSGNTDSGPSTRVEEHSALQVRCNNGSGSCYVAWQHCKDVPAFKAPQ